jgi:mono/diheme cytochrome c family protein
MLRKLIILASGMAGVGVAAFWVITEPKRVLPQEFASYSPNPTNGRAMFYAGGCAACHAIPGNDDRTRLGGGLGLKSPFGTFYVPNISSDPEDGIGRWSEVDFVNALWRGTSPNGSHYFPAFPYASYQRMKLEDVRDLFSFIKTLPPVKGRVRDHVVSFPYNVRRLVGGWKFLYLDGKPFEPDPANSPQWNRGAYLVNGPGHCAECHSPRDPLGGILPGKRFTGGPNLEGEGWIPNITQKGLSEFSEKDIAYLLKTGDLPDGDSVGGAMVAVVRNTSQLGDDDLNAVAAYIKSLPPVEGPPKPAKK